MPNKKQKSTSLFNMQIFDILLEINVHGAKSQMLVYCFVSINQRYFTLLDSKASCLCDFYQKLIRHIPHLNVIINTIFIIIIHHD